jgi:hypothetical protein
MIDLCSPARDKWKAKSSGISPGRDAEERTRILQRIWAGNTGQHVRTVWQAYTERKISVEATLQRKMLMTEMSGLFFIGKI